MGEREAKQIVGAKYHKCSYKSKPGRLAKLKCCNYIKGSCKCMIKILISFKDDLGEVLDDRFIMAHSSELHSASCLYNSTNDELQMRINKFDQSEYEVEIRRIKRDEMSRAPKNDSIQHLRALYQKSQSELELSKVRYDNLSSKFDLMKTNYENQIAAYQNHINTLQTLVNYVQKENNEMRMDKALINPSSHNQHDHQQLKVERFKTSLDNLFEPKNSLQFLFNSQSDSKNND